MGRLWCGEDGRSTPAKGVSPRMGARSHTAADCLTGLAKCSASAGVDGEKYIVPDNEPRQLREDGILREHLQSAAEIGPGGLKRNCH